MEKTNKKLKNSVLFILLFSAVFLFSLSLGSGAVNMGTPVNGTNTTGSVVLNFSYVNGTDIANPTNGATAFLSNATGTFVNITTTSTLTCTNTRCWKTATASELTDGRGITIIVRPGNDTASAGFINSSINATHLTFYTNTPVCTFTVNTENVEYGDPIGITTADASTVDSLFTLTQNYTLYDSTNAIQQSQSGTTPTFSGLDSFDDIGVFTLAHWVTDGVQNTATCTNRSIFVKGNDGDVTPGITSVTTTNNQVTAQFNIFKNKVFIGLSLLAIIIIVVIIISIFLIQSTKKRR